MQPATIDHTKAYGGELPADRSLLVVDDDDVLCERLASAMIARGFDVTAKTTVADGLRAIAEAPPAFAIFDMKLNRR